MTGSRSKIIMVYPQMGFSGAFVMHPPLGLLYASIELVKHGIDVQIVDTRLFPGTWREELRKIVDAGTLAIGISVMSGKPIKSAVEIGHFIKSLDPEIKIIWGGPHATFFPDTILTHDWNCDYVVCGYAVQAFYELVHCLMNNIEPSSVKGVSYRRGNDIIRIPRDDTQFEFVDYKEIPYHLIKDFKVYGQLDQDKRIFSIYSAMGCPYKCSFCSAPAEYAKIKGRQWVPLPVKEVADHIGYLVEKYNANYIYFIDNDSFVDIRHVESVINEINARKIKVGLGFRGARINEIKKMSDTFLDKLADAGTDILHIGAESGSDRILQLMNKNCSVRDIIECNIKLSRHPGIIAAYNFIMGIPTETLDDIKATRDLMFRLVEDNPNCIIFQPNKFRPLPGTKLFESAKKEWGYKPPETLEEWSNIEVEGDFSAPWYTGEMKKFCDLMLIGSYFIDNKINKVTSGRTMFYKLLRIINAVYGPVARFRLRHGIYQGLLEYQLYKVITIIVAKYKKAGFRAT
ncbi:MAG: B12-binding domain-containing radical SAM protein [Nitrospirae bacterium]|nr:B12-binding domain-containing radical SAM protein [Nitrospirota bacterium]